MSLSISNTLRELRWCLNQLVGMNAPVGKQLITSPFIPPRTDGVRPDYPFGVVDRLNIQNYGINGVAVEFLNDDGFWQRETEHKIPVVISIYSNVNNAADDIAHTLRRTLFQEHAQRLIREKASCGIVSISDPEFSNVYLNTEYQESSSITVMISVVDVFIDTYGDLGSIEQIEISGNTDDLPIVGNAP